MKWLKRRILDWLHSPEEIAYSGEKCVKAGNDIDTETLDHDRFWAFRVFPAVGGKIVEVRHYDDSTGKSKFARYLIDDNKDFPTALGKIVSMEFLKS